jgi:3-methylcrotonyl-CoA carboxylase beta subunit
VRISMQKRLGGAVTHTELSGIADYKFKTEQECLDQVKGSWKNSGRQPMQDSTGQQLLNPQKDKGEIYGILSEGNTKPYNMLDLIDCIVDKDSFDEFKKDYGKTIVCGYARIDGWAVGIVANQRIIVKSGKKVKCSWVV